MLSHLHNSAVAPTITPTPHTQHGHFPLYANRLEVKRALFIAFLYEAP